MRSQRIAVGEPRAPEEDKSDELDGPETGGAPTLTPGGPLGEKCALDYPLQKHCPTQGCVTMRNITLRNVRIERPLLSPGVILGNASNPIGLAFENVTVDAPGAFPFPSVDPQKRGPGRPRKDGANKGEKGSGKKPIVGSLEDENPHALGKYAVPPGR